MKKLLRHLSSCGLAARGGWPLLLAVALAALWAAPAQAVNYGLKICGVRVTDENKDDLTVIPGVTEGTATYDPATRTLRLKDAFIEAPGYIGCIENTGVDWLTIEVEGQCAMTSDEGYGISMGVSTTIAGKSGAGVRSLVVSTAGTGVQVGKANYFTFTIRDVDLTVTGQKYGIAGNAGENMSLAGFVIVRDEKLIIENASVRAKGGQGSIYNFSSLTLEGCMVLTPEGAAFDGGALKKDGEVVTGEAVIGRSYGLYVCGVPVTDANKNDLSAIPGVTEGTVTFDPDTGTLRLKDAVIGAGDNSCIDNAGVDGLTVEVEGQCAMTSDAGYGISMGVATTIAGKSGAGVRSLVVSAAGTGVHVGTTGVNVGSADFYTCTISDVDLTVTGQEYGIAGNVRNVEGDGYSIPMRNKRLTIKNASVRAKGGQGSICNFASVTLKDCMVLTPEGAAFDNGMLRKDGALVTGEAVIGRKYDLRICGVQVTDANKDDLSAIPGVTGTATYNPYANVLRLKDAAIVAADALHCIVNENVDGLTVEVEGKCAMTSNEGSGIVMGKSTVIAGKSGAEAPTLSVVAGDRGVWVKGGMCAVVGLDLTATGKYGIAGNKTGETLTVENASVRATGGQGSICDFASVTLDDCKIVSPAGAAFDGGTLKQDGEAVTGEAVIALYETYGLYVCDVQVTDWNKDDLSAIPGVTEGTATYDPATKTLRLKDARIETTDALHCIVNENVDGLTVEVEGKCAMTSNEGSGIVMDASTVIAGKSGAGVRWLVVSAAGSGVHVGNDFDCTCTISEVDLTVTGQEYGIAGIVEENGHFINHLTIKNATVRATGGQGSIYKFSSLTLEGCMVLTPEGAAFDGGALKKDGEVVTGEAVIGRSYGLYVCGVPVTDWNHHNLSSIPGVKEGAVTYDPATKTLWLRNARIEADAHIETEAALHCIVNENVEGLTIEVEGLCTMAAIGSPIVMDASTVIAGSPRLETPSLRVYVSSWDRGIIVENDASCTVRDLDLTVIGQMLGIAGNRTDVTLTVENATVRATGEEGSITGFKSVTLKDCHVVTPAGAAFDGGALMLGGAVVTGEAVILPTSVGIGTTAVDAPRREGTYTLTGVRLTAPLDQLPRGVYVVDGQKVVKK